MRKGTTNKGPCPEDYQREFLGAAGLQDLDAAGGAGNDAEEGPLKANHNPRRYI